MKHLRAKVQKSLQITLLSVAFASCSAPENSIEVKTAREAAAKNCDERGKCVADPTGLVLYNPDLVTDSNILKRVESETLVSKIMNLINEPKLLVTADKLEPLMRGVAIVGEFEPCDSPKGIDGANPTAGQLRVLKQGRYKACITYIGDGLFKRAYSLAAIDVDTTPPEIDGNGVAHSNLTPISANLTWSKAGDNLTLDGKLLYRIYTSNTQPMKSLDAVRLYGTQSPGRVLGGTSYVLTGLSEVKNYHAAVVVSDEAGNESLIGDTTFKTPAADTQPPSLTISSTAQPVTNLSPIPVTINFSESVTGFEANDLVITGGALQGFSGANAVYTFAILPSGDGPVAINVAAGVATDSAGNANIAATPFSLVFDSTAPVQPLILDPAKSFNASFSTTISQGVPVDANFKEFRYTLNGADPTCSTGTASSMQPTSVTIPAQTTTLRAVTCDHVGQISPVNIITFTYDSSVPTVAITSTPASGPTNNSAITLTFTFSEPVNGFASSDVVLTNATAGTFTATSSTVYTLAVTATGSVVTANVGANAANDFAGNGSAAATQWSIAYDNSAPTVAITSNRDPGPTNNSAITLTFTFSEGVAGFDASDVSVTNAIKGTFTATSSTVYTLALNATGSVVTADVAANTAMDSAGNGNTDATQWSMTYDNSAPTVTITSNRDPGPTNNSAITLTFIFSEAVTGFDATDVSVANATKGTFTATSSNIYTLALIATGSALTADVAVNAANDISGNGNTAAIQWSMTYDNSVPTLAITSNRDPGPTNNSSILLTFTFSEPVAGLDASDVTLTNATKDTFTATSASVYTLAITPTGSAVSASVPANRANDLAGNGNTASSTWSITYDNTPPSLTAFSITPASPTNNQIPTVSFTLSEAASVRVFSDAVCQTSISALSSKSAGAQTLSTNSLAEGTYGIYLLASDAAGNSSACTAVSAAYQVSLTPPGAPINLAATPGDTSVSLSWNPPASSGSSPLTDYVVRFSTNGGTTWTSFVDNVVPTTGVVVSGLVNGTIYAFSVAAVNVAGTGVYSSNVTGIIPRTVPGAPTGITGTAGDAQVSLTWSAPSSNGGSAITDYVVQYSSDNGTTWVTFNDSVSTTASTVVNGLTNGTAYRFRVAAVNVAGQGTYSNGSAALTPSEALAPNVTGLTSTVVSASQINLSWTSGGSNTNQFQIAYKTGATAPTNCSSDTVILASVQGSATTAAITGLTAGTQYSFRVCATNLSGALNIDYQSIP